MTCTTQRHDLKDLPPSAKLVYKVLSYEGPSTQQELATEARLPERTARFALNRLEEEKLIEERIFLQDARQRLYALAD